MDAFPPNTHPPTGDPHLDAAIRAIGAGDPQTLTTMLDDQPALVDRRIEGHEEYGRGYFTRPQLHHFTAFNPWWHDDTVVPPQTPRILELLLDRGADPESLCGPDDDPNQWTVLGLITSGMKTRQANIEDALLDVLQAAGARLETGIIGAVAYGEWASLHRLIDRGVAHTPMVQTVLNDLTGLEASLESLRDAGPDDASIHGETLGHVLYTAIHRGNRAAVGLVLDAGADPNAKNPSPLHPWNTPMHQAAWADQPEILADLVDAGGRVDVRDDHHGGTPLDWAQHGDRQQALEFLRGLAQ